jgi:hypothetical protein
VARASSSSQPQLRKHAKTFFGIFDPDKRDERRTDAAPPLSLSLPKEEPESK